MTHALIKATTLWQLLLRRTLLTPTAIMVIEGRTQMRITFAQALDIAERLAAGFYERGIRSGTTVTWMLPTGLRAVITSLALARLGALQNPIISLYGEREVRAILERNRSAYLLIADNDGRDYSGMARLLCEQLAHPPHVIVMGEDLPQGRPSSLPPPPVEGQSVRWVYYTSGTTSEPKGACHTDETLMIGGRNLARAMGGCAADIGSIAFPIAHIGGAMYTCMVLASGMSMVLLDRFQAQEAATVFRRYNVTLTGGSTAHYQALLAEQRRCPHKSLLPALRLLSGGGAPKPPELYYQIRREMGCSLTHNYGMTEVPLICAGVVTDTDEQLANTEGVPVDDVELRIVGADGRLAGDDESGEVRLRGKGVFKGYTDPALTTAAFDNEGFFRTGDLALRRPDGRIVITGRLKDVIIRKGENISAKEIEDLLFTHPKVAGVAVIGVPDEFRGERVCAVIELKRGVSALPFEEMVAFFETAQVMRQKIPEQLEIVEQLPRNDTLNKVLKHVLRERFSR
jgi:acyl-coenzyme A synthetase/AMP-(fatty) acid ligase